MTLRKPLILYGVYAVDGIGGRRLLRRTRAPSPEKAVNNTRFRCWGETPADDLGVTLEAEPIAGVPVIMFPRQITTYRQRERQLVFKEFLRPNPAF